MASSPNPHVVVFPFMAHSHTIPLIDLSTAISRQQVKVTIVTVPSNSKYISPKIQGFPLISLVELHFPDIDGLPQACQCENLSEIPSMGFFISFLTATIHLQNPFQQLLQSMADSGDLPLCVISDFFLGWTFGICQKFGVPRLVFHASGVLLSLIDKTIMANAGYTASSSSISTLLHRLLPNLPFNLTATDVPDVNLSSNTDSNPFAKFMAEAGEAELQSFGVIINSFLELEIDYIPLLESHYSNGAKVWCVGPTFLYGRETNAIRSTTNHHNEDKSVSLMKWLDAHAAEASAPVIYAAFGSLAVLTDAELEAVALGLEDSGCPFVLVIRSNTWCAPKGIGSKGMIVRGMVDQIGVLFHSAIGGFLSHCGWNSVLESLASAVPILAWPMLAEQKLCAKYIAEGLGIGIGIGIEKGENEGRYVSREKISAGVRELMIGEKGKKARERVGELARVAQRAVQDGGSSDATLKNLIQELGASRSKNCEEKNHIFIFFIYDIYFSN